MRRDITEPIDLIGSGDNYYGKATYFPDGKTILRKGSMISGITTQKCRENTRITRDDVLKYKCKDNCLIEDVSFDSPSEAGSVLTGSMRSGYVVFHTLDGIRLGDYLESDIDIKAIKREKIDEDDADGIVSSALFSDAEIDDEYIGDKPSEKKASSIEAYSRNNKASNTALAYANYKCEVDNKHETFMTKSGNQYVEGHHLIPLSTQKDFDVNIDVPANIVSLCPLCHKRLHYGSDIEDMLKALFDQRKVRLENCGISITFEELLKYYK